MGSADSEGSPFAPSRETGAVISAREWRAMEKAKGGCAAPGDALSKYVHGLRAIADPFRPAANIIRLMSLKTAVGAAVSGPSS